MGGLEGRHPAGGCPLAAGRPHVGRLEVGIAFRITKACRQEAAPIPQHPFSCMADHVSAEAEARCKRSARRERACPEQGRASLPGCAGRDWDPCRFLSGAMHGALGAWDSVCSV